MEAKTSVDMPSTTVSSEKNDEGFIVPSARAVETASKIEVEKSVPMLTVGLPAASGTNQVADITEEPNPLELSKEALARRPSFRRIYNDLASTDSDLKQFQQHANALSQIQLAAAQAQLQQQQQQQPALETTPSSQPMDTQQILQQTLQLQSMLLNAGINPAQAIALSQNSLGQLQVPAAQLLANNTSSPSLSVGNSSSQVSSPLTDNEMNMTNSIPRSVGTKLTCSPATPMTPEELAEESQRKRDVRLRKNREAAKECRRKKKEYVRCLENRVAVLESQNQALIGELRALKELYLPKQDNQ